MRYMMKLNILNWVLFFIDIICSTTISVITSFKNYVGFLNLNKNVNLSVNMIVFVFVIVYIDIVMNVNDKLFSVMFNVIVVFIGVKFC